MKKLAKNCSARLQNYYLTQQEYKQQDNKDTLQSHYSQNTFASKK